ncbi:trans-aconitate 2-methyltransferase [Streptomyces poonensis]|uniref:Trans-aconitate 2-methyltransferase n=1 Tax=Streptomyces poonensis TaxID=68255 RepID=A0A918UKK2_9ACTN|nr:trans-aconitate 2-methyltransferase [Streptomyces poonensis]GGZ16401.1 trans-aconitate 2-methyltransferase [Streptomyces poonensis]GLJ90851.1 trans-aconitate 2-methyltransferase [Streptomyces poonensis]
MPATTPVWDPHQYLRHSGHRARAFLDLLAHVPDLPAERPRIADLGCGPGNVTRLLTDRWPTAHITGLDNSPEMLAEAQPLAGPTPGGGRLDFASADVLTWAPPQPYDLIVSNAALQWVPGHLGHFPVLVDALAPGGVLAFQVPSNFDAPSHRLMRELAGSARWKDRLGGVLRHEDAVHSPAVYLEALAGLGCEVDVWETTYQQILQGEDAVLDWVKGTGLRPVLTALGEEAEPFVEEYRELLREAYPAGAHGTVFPFRRVFVVGRVGATAS